MHYRRRLKRRIAKYVVTLPRTIVQNAADAGSEGHQSFQAAAVVSEVL